MKTKILLSMLSVFLFPLIVQNAIIRDALAEENRSPQGKSRRAQVLSPRGFNIINAAREAMEQNNYSEALESLNDFILDSKRLKDYDKAKALQMIAYIHINRDDYPKAIASTEKALALSVLDEYTALDMRYNLASLYSATENYAKSIEQLEIWFKGAENPNAQAYFTAAQAYALLEDYPAALNYARQGMHEHNRQTADAPKENWYRLLLSIYLQMKDYQAAIPVLETMITHWPARPGYYQQLSGLYQQLDRTRESYAMLSIAYQNALLSAQNDFQRLTQLYRFFEYPYKGAVILQHAIEHNEVEKSEKVWEELANAWLQAREWQRANPVLQKAAQLSATGKHWLYLCQSAFQEEQWQDANQYCKSAIEKGGLDNEAGIAWQLLALSQYHTGLTSDAAESFQQCSRWKATAENCGRWSEHLSEAAGNL